jgi:hypothetical protein
MLVTSIDVERLIIVSADPVRVPGLPLQENVLKVDFIHGCATMAVVWLSPLLGQLIRSKNTRDSEGRLTIGFQGPALRAFFF